MIVIRCEDHADMQRLVSQIALRVKREVIHTFLSDIGIQRLEAILEEAKENRRKVGHNNYTTLATVWLEEKKMTTTQLTKITVPNPYRKDSKTSKIFNFMADGVPHTLNAIVDAVYFPTACRLSLRRRRVASTLRTIRQGLGVSVDFDRHTETYLLVERTG